MLYFKDICKTVTDDSGVSGIDLTAYLDIKRNFPTTTTMQHTIVDGQSPESIAEEYYNDKEKWWIVCLFADIHDRFFDWPMPTNVFNEYINQLKSSGEITGTTAQQQAAVDVLRAENDAKRIIRILQPRHLAVFLNQMEAKVNG